MWYDFSKEVKKMELKFAHYGKYRDVNANIDEIDLFGQILSTLHESGRDVSEIQLVRKSDKYITALLYETDICRFKFNDRAKWIELPYSKSGRKKIYIEKVQDVQQYAEELGRHFDLAVRFRSEV